MRKRIFGLALALALCLGLLPGTAGAADLPGSFYVSIGGTRLTADSDLGNPLGDGTVSVSYEEPGGQPKWTINLNNAHLTDSICVGEGIVEVVLYGENSITTHDQQGSNARNGIVANTGSISLTGSGSLIIDVTDTGTTYPAAAIAAAASGPMSGDIKIEGISDLVLKGNAQAVSTSGDVNIIGSSVTASNIYTFGSNPVIGGRSVRISDSEINLTGAENCYGLQSSSGNIAISDSAVEVNSSSIAVFAGNQIQISNSTVTAASSASSGLYTMNMDDGTISIENNSVVTAAAGANWSGIYTPGEVTISDSEVTAYSPEGIALYTGYGIRITDSTVTAETEGGYSAVYTEDLIQISGSTVEASAAEGAGVFSSAEMTIEGNSNVTATGGGPGLIANGGLTVSGGTVDAVSSDYSGFQSVHSLTIDGGTFHAKGGSGYPAVSVTTTEEEEYKDDTPRDTSRITLAQGLGELLGGVAAVSDWYDVGEGWWSFMTSFIAPEDQTLAAEGANALNEVTIFAGHTVTFDTQDGAAAKSRLTADGGTVSKPADPVRSGYIFGGWYKEAGCETPWSFESDTVTADLTLYAKWTPKPVDPPPAAKTHTVRFLDGGTELASLTVREGSKAAPPDEPVKAGYRFTGWYTDPEGTKAFDFETPVTGDLTLYAKWAALPGGEDVPSGGGSSGRDDDDDDDEPRPPAAAATTITQNPDGSTTKTTTDRRTGAVTTVTTAPDGTSVTVVTDQNGHVVSTEASVPKGAAVLPAAPEGEVKITVKGGGRAEVTLPAESAGPGTVAVLVSPEGTKTVVRKSILTENGVVLTVQGSAVVRLEDRGRTFPDVPEGWKAEAAAFVSAREILNGGTDGLFRPDTPMTRAMLAVALHNLEGNPFHGTATAFLDVLEHVWYAGAVSWASARGIVTGYTDEMFGPGDCITREQLAVMLWRAAGRPAASSRVLPFPDADQAADYAREALCWAVEHGIIHGGSSGTLDPKGLATRAQTAQMLKNFLENG